MPFLELLVDINVAQIVKISMVGVHVLHHLVGVAPNRRAGICPDQGLDQDPGFGPHLVLPSCRRRRRRRLTRSRSRSKA